jgi:glyoxylase-like metal-dependent hydrolase (beta-lactamase superfamily II)
MANSAARIPGIPPHYSFALGEARVTLVADGALSLGNPTTTFKGVSAAEIESILTSHFLPIDRLTIDQNIGVVDIRGKRALFETGMGSDQSLGPYAGRLQDSLRQASISPASIDALVCSHAHPDHIGGICADDGEPLFPNATVYLSKVDFDFWTDERNLGTNLDLGVRIARKNLMPVRERIAFFDDGEEFLPGIRALFATGHTLGHSCFMVTSGDEQMYLIGDLSHHHVLLLERPDLQFVYDIDPEQAVVSRLKALDMLAETRTQVLAYHFPWPGIGHIGAWKSGFRFFPKPMAF